MVSCKISIPDGLECGKLIKYGSRKKHIIKIHNIEKTDAIHYLNDRMFLPLGVFNKVRRRQKKNDEKEEKKSHQMITTSKKDDIIADQIKAKEKS